MINDLIEQMQTNYESKIENLKQELAAAEKDLDTFVHVLHETEVERDALKAKLEEAETFIKKHNGAKCHQCGCYFTQTTIPKEKCDVCWAVNIVN